jgi:alanine transaminase
MYIFPQIRLPAKAVAEAERRKITPDLFYCLELLENTGVVVVPVRSLLRGVCLCRLCRHDVPVGAVVVEQGSGFGQRDGTYHFRTTFLPPEKDIDRVASSFASFHEAFLAKYK